jgi:hypothetical protein
MDFEEEFELEHLLFQQRRCRSCNKAKDLVTDFYKTRKGSGPSAYSYECKECTIKRVVVSRMTNRVFDKWEYPDW